MALDWQGDKVVSKMRKAQVAGVNETMAASVNTAKRTHTFQNLTATLEGSIDIVDYGRPTANGAEGVWGSRDVVYARMIEEGGVIKPKRAKALHFVIDGEHVTVQQVTIPAEPYLRPSADVEYPKLPARIRRNFEKDGT